MLSVAQAQAQVLERVQPLPAETVLLSSACLGRVLAESVASDVDMPPFSKALMDGYALRAAELTSGTGTFEVIEEIPAGAWPTRDVGPGQASRIMTGAPLPSGADAVVMVERTRVLDDGRVAIDDRPPQPGQNILPRGRETRTGEILLHAGTELRPQELGLLAAAGRTQVSMHRRPRVAILPTGDEIVEPEQKPDRGQIRNTNGPMLAGQVARAGGLPECLGIARDEPARLRASIVDGLQADVLLLSGGVSAGNRDFVPGTLAELGAQAHFHKVTMKPGKPVLFATRDKTVIFGLPGNPVSSLVCFELFVRPALRRLLGYAEAMPRILHARLTDSYNQRGDRPTYHPARLAFASEGPVVTPVPWFGSADLRAIASANAFVVFPAGDQVYKAGDTFPVLQVE